MLCVKPGERIKKMVYVDIAQAKDVVYDFIGRGEREVKLILHTLFPHAEIKTQVPIMRLIKRVDYDLLDEEFQKHNFDLVLYNGPNTLVIEVNYKHKETAAHKWSSIFTKLLIDNGKIPVTIDDYNCEYLFSDSKKLIKNNSWGNFIDVIIELQRQGINPNGSLL